MCNMYKFRENHIYDSKIKSKKSNGVLMQLQKDTEILCYITSIVLRGNISLSGKKLRNQNRTAGGTS